MNEKPLSDLHLTSAQNPRVKELVRLRSKAGERREKGVVLLEGVRELTQALRAKVGVREVFYCPELLHEEEHDLLARLAATKPLRVSVVPHVFEKIAYREHPGGLLVVAEAPRRSLTDLKVGTTPLVLIVDHVEKPGNIGALLRTADAAGCDAVLVCDCPTDLYNPNLIRASLGTVFSGAVVECSAERALEWLEHHEIVPLVATPEAETVYHRADMRSACALVVGSEAEGVRSIWRKAGRGVVIPMAGAADSLNVSTSAAILLYEAVRQRQP